MQSLMGGTPMANAPSNLGISPNQAAPHPNGSSIHLLNSQSPSYNAMAQPSSNTIPNHGGVAANGPATAANTQVLVYPALHLHPLNDTFAPKQISLAPPGPNNRIKIGRQTNAKTVPNPSNGYFDSKVLSRMHAEVWCQDGKVFIKDVKSSNGTFINGERLSPEAQESDVFELHSEDMVEFGIDIVSDDNKTIIHHKVACRAYLVITAEDALGLRNDFASLYRGGMHGGPLGNNGVGPGAEGGLRRGKAGFGFDHVLSKLQNELQKSKDTWTELGSLTSTMHDIHETLGGGVPPMTNPPYQHMVPALPSPPSSQDNQTAQVSLQNTATISVLQAQLSETQTSLASHVEKIKSLEGMLSEHASIKTEVSLIKDQMEQARREMEEAQDRSRYMTINPASLSQLNGIRAQGLDYDGDDDDDGASVASMETVTLGQEAKEDHQAHLKHTSLVAVAAEEETNHVGPRAPPDMPLGLVSDDAADLEPGQEPAIAAMDTATASSSSTSDSKKGDNGVLERDGSRDEELRAQNAVLSGRLEELAAQLEQALALSQGLQSQHAQVTETVKILQDRVQTLEKEVEKKTTAVEAVEGNVEAVEGRLTEWKHEIEEGWRKEREGWQSEREELRKVVKAWDEANRSMEEEWNAEIEGEPLSSASPSSSSSSSSSSSFSSFSVAATAGSSLPSESLPPSSVSDAMVDHKGESGSSHVAVSNAKTSLTRPVSTKRRKRHVNSALRSLLYGSSAAGLTINGIGPCRLGQGLHEDDQDHDIHNWGNSSSAAATQSRMQAQGRWTDDDNSSNSPSNDTNRSVTDSNSTRPSTATGVTSPDPAMTALLEGKQSHHHESQQQDSHAQHKPVRDDIGAQRMASPASYSAAAAVGVLALSLAAYALNGKGASGFVSSTRS